MMQSFVSSLILVLFVQQIVSITGYSNSWLQSTTTTATTTIGTVRSAATQLYNTGGWGVGPQREMVPEEFATRSDKKRIFEGYELRDRADFNRQLRSDKDTMYQDEMAELLGVAKIAGINVKNPKDRLNKFEPDDNDNDMDDDIDVRVVIDDDEDNNDDNAKTNKRTVRRTDESITRLDEDTGALGVW